MDSSKRTLLMLASQLSEKLTMAQNTQAEKMSKLLDRTRRLKEKLGLNNAKNKL